MHTVEPVDAVDAIHTISHSQCTICDTRIEGGVTLLEVPSQPVGEVTESAQRTIMEAVAPQELVDRVLH
jgi:hypothetical protein